MIKSLSFEALLDNRSQGDNYRHNDTSHRPFCRPGAIFIEHPIMSFVTKEIKMAAVSAKRSIGDDAQKSQNTQFQPIGAFDLQIKTLEFENIFTVFDGAAEVKFEIVF